MLVPVLPPPPLAPPVVCGALFPTPGRPLSSPAGTPFLMVCAICEPVPLPFRCAPCARCVVVRSCPRGIRVPALPLPFGARTSRFPLGGRWQTRSRWAVPLHFPFSGLLLLLASLWGGRPVPAPLCLFFGCLPSQGWVRVARVVKAGWVGGRGGGHLRRQWAGSFSFSRRVAWSGGFVAPRRAWQCPAVVWALCGA